MYRKGPLSHPTKTISDLKQVHAQAGAAEVVRVGCQRRTAGQQHAQPTTQHTSQLGED